MPRYALKIEYNGAAFAGWQRQNDQPSVQGVIEAALAKLEPRAHTIIAAGRTDAGVHGVGQVAHCDMERDWTPFRLSEALNYHIRPNAVAIIDCAKVDESFHARFSARERSYTYRFLCRRAQPVLSAGQVWKLGYSLDIDAMREAATHLIGLHDFTTFRSTICQADSPVRTVDEISFSEHPVFGGTEIHMFVRARSFLHNQVRSFAGSFANVGRGTWTPDRMKQALDARDRAACGPVAPSEGLCFTAVRYDQDPFAQG